MALTSSSTYAEALAQYNDNLTWEGTPSKAVLALEAVRWLLVNRPAAQSIAGRSLNYASLETEKTLLQNYVEALGATASAGRAVFVRGVPRGA